MSDQSNQSDHDSRVKDILDRVAQGHLSSDEAATLIAALSTPRHAATSDATTPDATAGDSPSGTAQPGSAGQGAAADDAPSASVWADVVDSPDTADADSADAGSASTSATDAPAAGAGSASSDAPSAPQGTAGAGSAGDVVGQGSGVQDSVVDDAPAEDEDVEAEHSNVPVPAGVQRVTIRAIGRRVRLIGEPAINGVAVDGPHVIKRDGDTLAISSEGDMGVSIDGFSMLRNPTNLKSHVNGLAKELSIRVNPALQVEIEVTGGSVVAERLPGLTRVRVTAGTAKVTDVDGPIDLLVQAGSANLDAQITKGRSRVRVESGSANVTLRRGSDVRVHTEAQLGRVTWTGAVNGQSKDVEIGRGRAALDVEVLVGAAQIISD
ncbi:hypothetical protein EV644_12171 [Kribbella orskensis]|uniref:Adhesin n=1 Tax=Kribbella orskensis TaxID=2512216 RepID=A0ABY2BAQ4_9ACTN|nr:MULTISPECIES: hypothetical protein [Kribbella]TCN33602.1 hypothetical protein EV642_12361 [Kribbella sp. VKM Ac-2500]TCO13991.1 hypothetical protein EV644_12171 [Kribbella orskensis]